VEVTFLRNPNTEIGMSMPPRTLSAIWMIDTASPYRAVIQAVDRPNS